MTIFGDIAKRAARFTADNSPAILSAVAVTGAVTTAYLAGRASFEAANVIALKEGVEGVPEDPREQMKERLRLVWKLYIPAIGTGVMTVACIIGANRIETKRAAAMAAAYSLTEKAFGEYKEKVVERLGSDKERDIRDEIAQDRVTNNPPVDTQILIAGGGDVLCYDKFSDRYFTSDIETIKAAQNRVNYQINNDFYASLTDFYYAIGLPSTGYSDEVGWNADRLMEIQFSATLAEANKRPCMVIEFVVEPIRGYHRMN